MLGVASQSAPEMHHLELQDGLGSNKDGNEFLLSLSALTGLKSLTFGSLTFPNHGRIRDILDLSRLECLEVWLAPCAANSIAATFSRNGRSALVAHSRTIQVPKKALLQELDVAMGLQYATAEHGDAFWSTLARLNKLIRVKISLYQCHGPPDRSWALFFRSISKMSQVR